MEYYEGGDDSLTNFKTEYPTIVFDNTSDAALSYEPMVSPLNENKIDFRISFDEFDDEDYMVIFDENSFSYKIISVDKLKMDSNNENDKVNMPSFPLPDPMISHSDDLYFFKDFEDEFPIITYNDDLTSKLTKPYDIQDDEINATQSSGRNAINIDNKSSDKPLKTGHDMAPLPSRDQRHPWLSYLVEGYAEDIVYNFEQRLETIWGRSVNRVDVLDFATLTDGMRQTLGDRLRMVYIGDDRQELFTSHACRRLFEIRAPLLGGAIRRMTWRQFILALGLHTDEEIEEAGFGAYWLGSERVIPNKGDLRDYWIEISFDKDFFRLDPSYIFIRDPMRRLCHRMIACSISGRGQAPKKVTRVDLFYLCSMDRGTANVSYPLAQYLFRHAEARKSGARFSGVTSLGVLQLILDWLPDTTASAPRAAEDAPAVDEGAQADPAPVKVPQPSPPAPRTMQQRISMLEEEAFDSTLVGRSQLPYQRRTRRRTDDASTSSPQQPDL
ncbi:hypothetical protein Tco_0895339 [Tanacetum coccineum]|uniref:Uncharacterized protein n=1 Tax=Tanacetum coccineum TaxID=301880 RepID=A0ABQ5CFV1_9ASTR